MKILKFIISLFFFIALTTSSNAETTVTAEPAIIPLPRPNGGFSRFSIVEPPIMHPALAAKFPEIKTYAGQGLDDPAATVRIDIGPKGFHAQILSPNGAVYIDPFTPGDKDNCICYYKKDYRRTADEFKCHVLGKVGTAQETATTGTAARSGTLMIAVSKKR